jgi:hypothetical protein
MVRAVRYKAGRRTLARPQPALQVQLHLKAPLEGLGDLLRMPVFMLVPNEMRDFWGCGDGANQERSIARRREPI